MTNEIEIPIIKLQIQETVDEFIYKAVEPFAETVIGKVSKEEMAQILRQGTRKGYWIVKPNEYGRAFCSECNFELRINDTKYCPNCGAKMEVRDE